MKKSRFTEDQIVGILKEQEAGVAYLRSAYKMSERRASRVIEADRSAVGLPVNQAGRHGPA